MWLLAGGKGDEFDALSLALQEKGLYTISNDQVFVFFY